MRTLTHFYPRPPCGGRPVGQAVRPHRADFYPRPPCGDDPDSWYLPIYGKISIHVPLAGDDLHRHGSTQRRVHFYPRPPCGGRPFEVAQKTDKQKFLSTSPLRGTTPTLADRVAALEILSTSPLRGTTETPFARIMKLQISIHVPLAGDDGTRGCGRRATWNISIHVPLAGDDITINSKVDDILISIHVPLAGDDGKCDGKYGVFPRTFVTTRHSVQKHAAFLCSMRPFSRRICTKRPKHACVPRCEPPGVFLRAEGSHRLFLCGGRFCTGAFTPAKYRPAPIAARGRHARPWFCTGCPAGKSAGCPLPGR